MTLTITSSGFKHQGSIPKRYTCDGENISPPLAWAGVPPGTKSLALVVDAHTVDTSQISLRTGRRT